MGPSQEMPSPPNGPPQVHLGPDLVFAAKRVNKAPKAVVRPAEQTIQLPTRTAIVDASDSSDDATAKDALKFKWELTVNPVSESPKLHSTD